MSLWRERRWRLPRLPLRCRPLTLPSDTISCLCFTSQQAGNLKATTPIAFTTTLLVWALMAFQPGFQARRAAA